MKLLASADRWHWKKGNVKLEEKLRSRTINSKSTKTWTCKEKRMMSTWKERCVTPVQAKYCCDLHQRTPESGALVVTLLYRGYFELCCTQRNEGIIGRRFWCASKISSTLNAMGSMTISAGILYTDRLVMMYWSITIEAFECSGFKRWCTFLSAGVNSSHAFLHELEVYYILLCMHWIYCGSLCLNTRGMKTRANSCAVDTYDGLERNIWEILNAQSSIQSLGLYKCGQESVYQVWPNEWM